MEIILLWELHYYLLLFLQSLVYSAGLGSLLGGRETREDLNNDN